MPNLATWRRDGIQHHKQSLLRPVMRNKEEELRQAAERAGWEVIEVYKDHGISGAKGRDKRPAFNAARTKSGQSNDTLLPCVSR
jgi:DNA invertase Pin-like site-specific DNA recombinase